MDSRFVGRRFLGRLQSQVARAEPLDAFQLAVELGEVAFFVANQPFEDLLGGGVRTGGALQSDLIVGIGARFVQLAGLGQHSGGIGNLDRRGRRHLHVAFQEQDALE